MKILVTGATGFVGSSVCKVLLANGHRVSALVRSDSMTLEGVEYYRGCISDQQIVNTSLREIDCIVHLAAVAHQFRSDKCGINVFRTINRDATLKLAAAARKEGVRRFIYVSSIGVNGPESYAGPFDEGSPERPQANYAISKYEAELGVREELIGSDTEFVIIRPPLVYDAEAPGNFSRLARLVASGMPLPFGCLNNQRSLISLDNLVSFLLLCVDHPAAKNELFLVSDGQDLSTRDIVAYLSQGMGKKPLFVPVPDILLKVGARVINKESLYVQLFRSLQIDSSKARILLGWVPCSSTAAQLVDTGRRIARRFL